MNSQRIPTSAEVRELTRLYREAVASGVPIESLDKRVAKLHHRQEVVKKKEHEETHTKLDKTKKSVPWYVRAMAVGLPALLLIIGVGLVGSAVAPITQYYVVTRTQLAESLQAPIPEADVLDVVSSQNTRSGGSSVFAADNSRLGEAAGPRVLDQQLSYLNLAQWFPDTSADALENGSDEYYTIDIPKVDVQDAKVKIGGTNLDNSLIQYPGTADPGELGSPVIFGHSVLRQFYNPSTENDRRYISIFSYIMTLEDGDDIYVTHDGVRYHYKVRSKTEVKPEDTYILGQRRDSRLLKLVTCTPEGTYLRRGVVTAELVN